uniref:Uncharacterized protein n=1 Tax=Caenorhabditis japonica TaxID=281687 RepID=A0A8R1ET73_CAEJA
MRCMPWMSMQTVWSMHLLPRFAPIRRSRRQKAKLYRTKMFAGAGKSFA